MLVIVLVGDAKLYRSNVMLLDVRTYTCYPGTIKPHLALYRKIGKDVQIKHLGLPVAFLICESGNPNQYIHIWAYESADDREKKRDKMWADPDWINYTEKSAELGALAQQENKLMKPVEFFSINY